MLKKLLFMATLALPSLLWAQEGEPVSAVDAKLLVGKWEVVVAYGWIEFPGGQRNDQPTEKSGKIVLGFSSDGGYSLSAEGEEPETGSYRVEGEALTVVTAEGEEVQHIEHLNPTRCVISTSDADPESDATLWMRMVMMRVE